MDIAELVEEIEAAWRDAQTPVASNISQPTYDDEGVSAYFKGRTWHGHTALQLRCLSFAPGILTHEAFAYFLPAYMKADLEEPKVADTIVESLLYALDPGPEGNSVRAVAIVALLDERQRQVVLHYVDYVNEREFGIHDGECRRIIALLSSR